MNEQIRKIESRAWGQVPRTNGLVRTEDFNEKFAELIVKECMTICKEHPSGIVSNNWRADYVAQDIMRQFEEHFGVEE